MACDAKGRQRRSSVKTRLLATYSLAALITIVASGIGILTFTSVKLTLNELVGTGFSTVDTAHQLAQETRSISAIAPIILSAKVQSQRITTADQIADQLDWVAELIGKLKATDLTGMETIESHKKKLLQSFEKLDEFVEQRIAARSTLDELLSELQKTHDQTKHALSDKVLAGELESNNGKYINAIVGNLVNLYAAAAATQKLETLEKTRLQYYDLRESIHSEIGRDRNNAELQGLVNPLFMFGDGESNIFSIHELELKSDQSAQRLVYVYNRYATRLVFAATALIATAKEDIQQQTQETNDELRTSGTLLLIIAVACVIGAALLARHVGQSIGKRLMILEKSMELHAAGGQGEINTEGNDEISRMAAALKVFIDTIRQREEQLRNSEERFRDFAEASADWFFEMDDSFLLKSSEFDKDETQYTDDLLLTVAGSFKQSVQGKERSGAEILVLWNARKPFEDYEIESFDGKGQPAYYRLNGKPLFDDEKRFLAYRIAGRDVTEAHKLAAQLTYQARHDALTGLVNRREFEIRLRETLKDARLQTSNHCLCYFDLDQFKIINDTCGHVAGDELLRQVSSLLMSQIRKRDTLARLGGDEFGLLMEHCTTRQAARVTETIRAAIADFRFAWEEKSFTIGVSIGLVPISADSGDLTSVLRAADSACYAAKDAGRNRVHVYHEDDELLARRQGEMQWIGRIHEAMEENRLLLYQQPIVPAELDADSGQHYEILLRMLDRKGNLIMPGAFLPAAERYNLSMHLDRWVFRSTLEWLSSHPSELEVLHLCCINISGQSVGKEFLAYVNEILDSTKVPPEKICLEITETAAVTNLSTAEKFIRSLKKRGCKFALDDFGSGLSSFAYLKNLSIDYLKIDGQFVRDIVDDDIDAAMVKSINEIGQIMGKKTIAEFVENEAIVKKLRELGVDYLQGYGIGKPQPLCSTEDRALQLREVANSFPL